MIQVQYLLICHLRADYPTINVFRKKEKENSLMKEHSQKSSVSGVY